VIRPADQYNGDGIAVQGTGLTQFVLTATIFLLSLPLEKKAEDALALEQGFPVLVETDISVCPTAKMQTISLSCQLAAVMRDINPLLMTTRTLVYAVECPIQNCRILALIYG